MNRISQIPFFSFLLSLLVVIIHNPVKAYYGYGESTLELAVHYFINDVLPTITSLAVPSFFIISAFLFFRTYTLAQTRKKLQSRLRTLVIPYLFWNTIGLLIAMTFKLPWFASFSIDASNPFELTTIMKGIFLHRYTPMWFVFGLIVYNLFCPVIYKLCSRKTMGIMGGVILYFLICMEKISNPLPEGCYFEVNSFFYYYVGAFLGVNFKELLGKEIGNMAAWVSGLLLLLIVFLELRANVLVADIPPIVTLAKCILLWCMLYPIVSKIKVRWWMCITFFIYATHTVIQRIIATALRIAIEKLCASAALTEALAFLLSVTLTIITCILLAKYWKKFSLKTFEFVTGNRV